MKWFEFARGGRRGAAMAALLIGLSLTGAGVAQTGGADQDSPPPPPGGIDLPDDLKLIGKFDPNIRKPTAIVNRTVITGTDVDQRLAIIVALNDIKLTAELRDQLRVQILRGLIDETLQIQEAASHDITITPDELTQGFARVSSNFKKTPDEMRKYLRDIGSSEASIKRQIEAELAWQRLLSRQVTPFINVGDEEVKSVIARIEASKGAEEYHLKEIFLYANAQNADQVNQTLEQVMEQMRKGAPFEYFAGTISEASTKSTRGDLGWVRLGVLPDALAQAAQGMQVGQVAGPIAVGGGYSLLYLVDKRQVLTADPRDAKLSLRQLTLRFPAGSSQAQMQQQTADFAQATQTIKGCGDVPDVAKKFGAEVVDNDSVPARQLPPQLQEILLKLQIGQASPPFGSQDQAIRVLVLCGRDDPRVADLPSMEEIRDGLEQQRISLRAERMLRDLRRDAIIEYR